METTTTRLDVIALDAIQPWGSLFMEDADPLPKVEPPSRKVDAVVNSTNESLKDTSGICRKLLDAAGREIWTECESVGSCRTGEAVVTRGCQLPAKKILHTVGPRYNIKYQTAAEHALHMCYRSCLSVAIEERLQTVAFPCVYAKKKGYPRDDAAHVALRTVRRFLEHYRDAFTLIIFCVDTLEDQLIYENLLPLYFPRSLDELQQSATALATRDLRNEFGEPVIEERKIRIGSAPSAFAEKNGEVEVEDEDDELTDDEDAAIQSFCEMTSDPDLERLERLHQRQEERQKLAAKTEKRRLEILNYQHALSKAQNEDFDDLRKRKFLYNGGVDHSGAPVMVYMASNLVVSEADLDRVMLYIIHTMDAIVEKQYSVLYVHSDSSSENQPTAAWLKRLFRTFASKYQQNLRFFYVLEPSVWLKLLLFVAKGFVSSAFYKKIVYIGSPKDLANVSDNLDLPHHLSPPKEENSPEDETKAASPLSASGSFHESSRQRDAML
ncbi:hypothetical protein Poli38472_003422 [Pythium oligandrum]|uniref:Macro domain-containing protein n=1 Tax=Pythium oligandrum TaxID=41045 RepID=A0A8K1FFB4_PYTOL|nr:hypothetical protein Poli38472_003422 [Pythium oligandrum]|eukprot:TMW57497.1 hypothetical protein Poli38472_003422 [Pythium oligandrum]